MGTINNKKRKRKITSKEKLTRVRTRNIADWKDNKAKQLLNLGEEHTNRAGKLINAKKWEHLVNAEINVLKRLMRKHVKEYLMNTGV